jgi:hypothetical protein
LLGQIDLPITLVQWGVSIVENKFVFSLNKFSKSL